MIVTISGMPGSGKSTVGKILAARMGYRHYSMGDLRGKMAQERGLTIDEFNALGAKEAWTDTEVDEYQRKLGEVEDNFVIDGWISFHFIPHSFKVFLDVDPRAAAERVFRDQRPDERRVHSAEEMCAMMEDRVKQTDGRYQKYYGFSFRDKTKYDLVIDTTEIGAEELVEKVLDAIAARGIPSP